jgi:hypothetical protein
MALLGVERALLQRALVLGNRNGCLGSHGQDDSRSKLILWSAVRGLRLAGGDADATADTTAEGPAHAPYLGNPIQMSMILNMNP